MLEPISLGSMLILSRSAGIATKMVFGYADTIAAASAAIVSALIDTESEATELNIPNLDLIVVCIQICVLESVVLQICHG